MAELEQVISVDLTESEASILLVETMWWDTPDAGGHDACVSVMRRIRKRIEEELDGVEERRR
jgi:hypothetical protein